jgi:hypothetical protein
MHLDTSYDNQLSTLADLNWLPWIGDNFRNKKVLLVGESHYDDKEGWLIHKDATRNFVNNQGLNSHNPDFKNRRFFQQIEKTLLNKETSSFEERNTIWRNVTYFNLVQRLLPSSADRPSDEDYDQAWRNFLSVADIIRPDICIKYGYDGIGRLGYLLHNYNTGWTRDDVREFYTTPYCINLTKDNYKLRIIFTHHPTGSRGFEFKEWAAHIRKNWPKISTLFT